MSGTRCAACSPLNLKHKMPLGVYCSCPKRQARSKVVRVFRYLTDRSMVPLIAELETFGKVKEKSVECVAGYTDVSSSIEKLRMEMVRSVLNLLCVRNKLVQCKYEAVIRVCHLCHFKGRHAAICTTPKCDQCGQFRHVTCKLACSCCQGDHVI